jgi:hypothetical protein
MSAAFSIHRIAPATHIVASTRSRFASAITAAYPRAALQQMLNTRPTPSCIPGTLSNLPCANSDLRAKCSSIQTCSSRVPWSNVRDSNGRRTIACNLCCHVSQAKNADRNAAAAEN